MSEKMLVSLDHIFCSWLRFCIWSNAIPLYVKLPYKEFVRFPAFSSFSLKRSNFKFLSDMDFLFSLSNILELYLFSIGL